MSSTRHALLGAPISYERYMSSPEFAALRGIPGTAVAAKAQLYGDARKRSLLFFLQSLSLREGGLQRVAHSLSAAPSKYRRRRPNQIADRTLYQSEACRELRCRK